jgi:hypothetical protein
MSRKRMLTGPAGPEVGSSICWHCGRMLQRAKGKGLGLYYFNLVQEAGHDKPSRVHGDCTQLAIDDGAKFVDGAKP